MRTRAAAVVVVCLLCVASCSTGSGSDVTFEDGQQVVDQLPMLTDCEVMTNDDDLADSGYTQNAIAASLATCKGPWLTDEPFAPEAVLVNMYLYESPADARDVADECGSARFPAVEKIYQAENMLMVRVEPEPPAAEQEAIIQALDADEIECSPS